MSRLPRIPCGAPVPGYSGAGLTRTFKQAIQAANDHATRSGVRHRVTRIDPDPDSFWAEYRWKFAWTYDEPVREP